ncbi:MAG: hypothetical protein KY468_04810, partial [Armatimonadetes bacterium]|nr:hypothetical protein [Armatimonadota bacterium]
MAATQRRAAHILLLGTLLALTLLALAVIYTPLSRRLLATLYDGLPAPQALPDEPASATVALSSDYYRIGDMMQPRLLKAYELVSKGYAPVLVLTRAEPRHRKAGAPSENRMRHLVQRQT